MRYCSLVSSTISKQAVAVPSEMVEGLRSSKDFDLAFVSLMSFNLLAWSTKVSVAGSIEETPSSENFLF